MQTERMPGKNSLDTPPPRGKTALVLVGGGIPGWMYEIGALTALDDFFDGFSVNQFDIYVGSSAGAAVAALMANGVRPRAIYEDIKNDRRTVFNFSQKDIYSFGLHETWHMTKKFFRSLFQVAKYYCKSRRAPSLLESLAMLQESLPSGIFKLTNLETSLEKFLSQNGYTNDFRKLKKELYIPAVDIDLGRYDVFGETVFDGVPISKAVTASSAVPILFQPVHINGRDYVDGSVGRVAYMDIAMNHGANLLWVINPIHPIVNDRENVCLPFLFGAAKCSSIKEKGMAYIYDQAMRISTATRIYLATKRYRAEYPEKEFIVMQPNPSDTILFAHHPISFDAKVSILKYGYDSTAEQLRQDLFYYQTCLNRYGIRVRVDRLRKG